MMKKLFFLLLIISNTAWTQTTDALFETANTFYKNGKYQEAIDIYNKIEAKKEVSSELYYNLGNAYYKLNKVAPTVYNYEKALKLNPLNTDAKNNLIFAQRLTLDSIEELPKSLIQQFNKNYLQKLTYNQWAAVCILLSFLAAILFLVFYFAETSSKKRLFFVLSSLSFLLLVATLTITYNQFNLKKNTVEAIIFSEEVDVKNAPTENSNDVFTIHEGTKVFVLDTVDNWKKIKLADGKIGWTIDENLKIITTF